jgi:hypothetical protein
MKKWVGWGVVLIICVLAGVFYILPNYSKKVEKTNSEVLRLSKSVSQY